MTKACARKPNTTLSPGLGFDGAASRRSCRSSRSRREPGSRRFAAPRRSRRLASDDRLDLIVGKDGIDIEAAAEAEGLVADEMRDFGQIDDGRVVRAGPRPRATASFPVRPCPGSICVAPASASASKRRRRGGSRRIDLDVAPVRSSRGLPPRGAAFPDWASASPFGSTRRTATQGRS